MLYQRQLLNEPEIQKELSGSIEYPHDITLRFSNADEYFTNLWDGGEEFRGKTVKLRRYEPNEAEFIDIFIYEVSGIITDFNILPDIAEFTLSVQDPDPLQTDIPKKLYEIGDWTQTPPLVINPTPDLGKPYPLLFGYCKKVPLRYVHADYTNDYYDYIVGRVGSYPTESNNSNKATTVVVYRNKSIVASSTYTVYDGSQASPYPGYAFIRFILEQRDYSNNLYEIHADFRGQKLGVDATATRNFAKVIQYLLSDSTWGLGLLVNSASFTTAISQVANLYCDGFIAEQATAQDIINELLDMCAGALTTNENGERVITIDVYQATTQASFGINDGYYNNIISINKNKDRPTKDAIKSITLNYRYNEWENTFIQKNTRSVFAFGEEVKIDARFVRDHTTADRITCYKQRLQLYGDHLLDIDVGMEGRFLQRFDPIKIIIPSVKIDSIFQVRDLTRGLNEFPLNLISYSSLIYDYSAGTLPGDENADDETDYSNTPSATPTSFSLTSWEPVIGLDGTTFQAANLQATAPSENFTHMIYGYKFGSGDRYTYFEGEKPASGYVWKGKTPILTPGQSYDFVAIAVNTFNLRSSAATLTAQVAPGDTIAPAQVTGMAGSGKYKTWHFVWAKNAEADLKSYHVQIGISGFGTVYFDKYIGGNSVDYTNDARGYGTLYCRVKAVDFTGNESASWSSIVGATTSQTQTEDINDGAVTTLKVGDLQVTNAKIANLAVDNAKIANLAVDNAKIANLAVDNAKIANLAVDTLKLSNSGVTYLKRQLVEEQSAAVNALADGGSQTITFTHNLGRNVLVTWWYNSINAFRLTTNVHNNGINSFDVTITNWSGATSLACTIYVDYW